ncbi:copper resistance CopC family protein [Leucobacter salsicius]|uniref:copper resistance CopC family protein n=1 Tax=Leucobacter salsicius TaxID=664638 RepID=UPI00034DFD5C|nr:copper resistance CopC family protein [Leucobacter salsicius]
MHTHAQANPFRSRVVAITVAVVAFCAVMLGAATPAFAHDQLVGTEVISGTDGKAQAVQLSFNNKLIELGAEFVIVDAAGTSVTDGTPEISGMDVRQAVQAGLAPGVYNVAWHVVSSDGHPIEGAFGLEIAADGSGMAIDAATNEPDPQHAEDESVTEGKAPAEGLSTGAIIAISVGGVLVLVGAIVTIIVGQRRRAQGMQ